MADQRPRIAALIAGADRAGFDPMGTLLLR
jgi:hypothetical protein